MYYDKNKTNSVILLLVLCTSIGVYGFGIAIANPGDSSPSEPEASDDYPYLANEDTIVDPRGQTVKQSQQLELGRSVRLDLIQPTNWSLNVFDKDIIEASIPMELALELGLTFPLNVETSYDPYAVHNGTSFPYVVEIDNNACTPSLDVGVDFGMDFSKLNFDFMGMGNLLGFAANWDPIQYSQDFEIPFYGVETKLGNWLSYDILDRYYSIEDILGIELDWDQFAIAGGVGVNIQYNLYSYVTAKATVDSNYLAGPTETNLRWNDLGAKSFPVSIDEDATHGELYSVEIGDWVYHIAHDVTFSVWADIALEVLSLDIIDETFDYAYCLDMGELTFPEREDYSFQSYPEVLGGKNVNSAEASWTAIGFDYGPDGGNFQAFDYDVEIPENENLQEWFSDMEVDFALGASLDVTFPFNMHSYYNARKVTNGSIFDYNLLVDSIAAGSPSISYGVDVMLDLSKVDIFGYSLDKYDFDFGGDLYSLDGMGTPFGSRTTEIELTDTIGLDTASGLLNEYISDMLYGINPDIQFQAWLVLQLDAYMTANVEVTGANVVETTELRWDEQFDTQTTRIQVPEGLAEGQQFTVNYTDITYHLELTPGVKLAASALGGVVAFDYTFMIPGVSQYLQQQFTAPDFVEDVTVNDLAFDVGSLQVNDPIVPDEDYDVTGDFTIENIGTVTDQYVVTLIDDNLPTGTSATCGGSATPYTTTVVSVADGANTLTVDWTLNLGANAHSEDYKKNQLVWEVRSYTDAELVGTLSTSLDILAEDGLIDTEVIMEETLNITPGVGVVVDVPIENNGFVDVDYNVLVTGQDTEVLSATSFTLESGTSTVFEYEIDVPAASDTVAGDFDVTVTVEQAGATDIVKTLTYTVPEFIDIGMELLSADLEVEQGQGSDFVLSLSNNGNIAGDVNVSVNGISGYTTVQELSVPSGATSHACMISLDPSDLSGGLNPFTVLIEDADGLIYSQDFTVKVEQLAMTSVTSVDDQYEYNGETLHYQIDVTNQGSLDTFDFEIVGLDSTAYTLDSDDLSKTIASSASVTLDLYINPSDITKVRGGTNGIAVKATSQSLEYSTLVGATGVKMPEIYHFKVDPQIEETQDTITYTMTFTIENEGNMADLFDIQIENAAGLQYEISSDSLASGSSNQVEVRRGEAVDVSVTFIKNTGGKFKPKAVVMNSEDEVTGSVTGSFYVGAVYSPAFMVSMIVMSCVVAIGVVSYAMYSRGITISLPENRVTNSLKAARLKASMKLSQARDSVAKKISTLKKDDSEPLSYEDLTFDEKVDAVESDKKSVFGGLKSKLSSSKEESESKAEDYWNLDDEDF